MDVRKLLLLAVDNSNIAKKKAARLDRDDDGDDEGVSNDAVASFLAKKQKFKEKLKAQEDEAKRKRVEARLNASLEKKPTRKEKKKAEVVKAVEGKFLPGDIRSQKAAKEKARIDKKEAEEAAIEKRRAEKRKKREEARRLQEEENREKEREEEIKRRERDIRLGVKKKTSSSNHVSTSAERDDRKKPKEKKFRGKEVFESSVTYASFEEKRLEKARKQKAAEKPKGPAGMSFNDLMKMAKTNAATTQLADDGTLVKRKEKKASQAEEPRSKHKEQAGKSGKSKANDRPSSSKTKNEKHRSRSDSDDDDSDDSDKHKHKHGKQKHYEHTNNKSSKLKHSRRDASESPPPVKHKHSRREPSESPPPVKRKHAREPSDSPPPVKRGLIATTIATKKSGAIGGMDHPGKTKKKLSGIAAQCQRGGASSKFDRSDKGRMKPKKKVDDDYEDELEREMRMLAKKRKAFERMQGRGGAEEEEFYDSEEDYDLDEEESDDDGFIDDSEAAPNVSKVIRKITGYDRRIYDDDDDEDIDRMESNYSQIQKEEARSARIAREEDRIEALKEAEELAREKAREKLKKKGR